MSTISFGGLSSGLDTEAIIGAIMGAEQIPLARVQAKKATLDSALSTINSITSRFSSLKSSAQALSTASGYASYKASSSDAAVVATVTGAAQPGNFDLTVQQLAKEQRTYSSSQTSGTNALGMAGDISLQIGSATPTSINVLATDSLSDVAAKINNAGLRVSASVLFDGTGYKLAVRGLDTGASNAITFGETGTTLGLTVPANTVQAAQNSQITIDGNVVTRSTNQVVGVVPGVTLALTKVSAQPVTVGVQADSDALKSKITTFLNSFNEIVSASQSAAGWGNFTKASNEALAGDATLRGVLDRLARSVGDVIPGTSGKYTTLSSIGLTSTKDGKLALDDTKLKAALEADPVAVSKLFVNDPATGSTGAMTSIITLTDALSSGTNSPLKSKADSLSAQSKRLDDDAASMQRRLDLIEAQMRERFTQLEMLMSTTKSRGNALLSALGSTTSE